MTEVKREPAHLRPETCADIWHCHREIETAGKLLEELFENGAIAYRRDVSEVRDAFGRKQHFQFGIPSGENGHRLYQVSPALAKYVIEAHIAAKTKELAELNIKARMELDGVLDGGEVTDGS